MEKSVKGSYGSLAIKKKNNLILVCASLAVVLAIFFIGLLIFQSRNNYMTLVAVVLCLPAGKIAVGYFILLPHKECSPSLYESVTSAAGKLTQEYDLIVSNTKKPVGIQACVITDHCICAYSNEAKTDTAFFQKSVEDFLKNEKLTVKVMLYLDEEAFLKKVRSLSANFDETNQEHVDKMKWNSEALLHMCL